MSVGSDHDYGSAAQPVIEELFANLDCRRHEFARLGDAQLRELIISQARTVIARRAWPEWLHPEELARVVTAEAVGLGPLESLLVDPEVSEIMVNGPRCIFVERRGRIERARCVFSGERSLRAVIDRMVTPCGRRVDESSPMVDARLADGSRVNVVLAPLSVDGAAITIRRFARSRIDLAAMIERGSMSAAMAAFLDIAVKARRNIVVAGGTGSGKTTLLNALSSLIPAAERLVTIEDAAELQLQHSNVVRLEARPANAEGAGAISIRELVRNALRMRPDRIVVGECRGGEALDMLQAMNTGHEGSLTTLHANTPRDVLSRLEIMTLMAGMDLPLAAIRGQIAGALDLIVQQARLPEGRRLVTSIVEILGIDSGVIQMQELFRYERRGDRFSGCGRVPDFVAGAAGGALIDAGLFDAAPIGGAAP
ncbi:MAG: CpaF family protein [Steroidobacteraceae bacterium]